MLSCKASRIGVRLVSLCVAALTVKVITFCGAGA